MADGAREMGVAPGTLYNYVESNEALFHLLIDRAFVDGPLQPPALPVPTPLPGATMQRLRERLLAETAFPSRDRALERQVLDDPAEELETVVREIYERIGRARHGGALIERSARDLPEMAALWFGERRRHFLNRITMYIQRRIDSGHFRPMPDAGATARLIVEAATWFARHRFSDPDPHLRSDESAVEETVIRFVVNALAWERR